MKVHAQHRTHAASHAAKSSAAPKYDAVAEQKKEMDMFAAVPKEVVTIEPPKGAPHGAVKGSLGWESQDGAARTAMFSEQALTQMKQLHAKEGGGWYEVKATITQTGGEFAGLQDAGKKLEAQFHGASAHILTDGEGMVGEHVTLKMFFPGASKAEGSYVPPPPAKSTLSEEYTAVPKQTAQLEAIAGSTLPAKSGGTQQVSGEAMSGQLSAEVQDRATRYAGQAMQKMTEFAERGGGGWYQLEGNISSEGGEFTGLMQARDRIQARWPGSQAHLMTESDFPVAGDKVWLKVKFPATQMAE